MKKQIITALVTFVTLASFSVPLRAQQVSFPAGDFQTSPESNWTTGTSGIGTTVTFPDVAGNRFGRISPVLLGSGSLTSEVGVPFTANSLYEVSVDIASSSLLAAGLGIGLEVLDGNDNVVATLDQDQLLNLIGINLGNLPGLTSELNLLDGALTDDQLLAGTLRDLLGSLLDGNGDVLDPALFAALQGLVNSLVGVDNSLLTEVTGLLESVLAGNILDPGGNPLDLADLLDPANGLGNIADILNLDLLDPGDLGLAEDIQDLITFLTVPGNDGPVENLVAVLAALLGNPGDVDLVNDLLATLLGEQDLVEGITNILNLELIEGDLIGSLTDGDLSSLLGFLNTGSGSFQTVKLLFTTGDSVPPGDLQVRLTTEATVSLASADFDNIALRRFNLVATPNPPGPGNPSAVRPIVRPKLPRVIRRTTSPRITIKGTARAFGEGNSIRAVFAKLKGKGTSTKDRKFKKVKGRETWVARVRVPVSSRTRVIFVSEDATGTRSFEQFVRVARK